MEKDVTLTCRSKDASLVNKAKDEAVKEFEQNAGFGLNVTVKEELPEAR